MGRGIEREGSMKVAVFSTKIYDREFLEAANRGRHELRFFEPRLNLETASLAEGFAAVCVFVNDHLDAAVIDRLADRRHAVDRSALRRLQ